MKEIIITGHTGFIGTSLTQKLISSPYKITGISRTKQKQFSIKQKQKDLNKITNSDIPKNSIIGHLSANADFALCQKKPKECFLTNVIGTEHLLEIARKKDCKLLFVGTRHIYGIPRKLPIKEDHCREANSIYSATKLQAEILCESFSKTYSMDITTVRLFSGYGPKSPQNSLILRIIKQLLEKNELRLGNLFPKRDFIFIDDVVSALVMLLKQIKGFNTFNIGSGSSTSIQTLCDKLMKLEKKTVPIIQEKTLLRKDDIPEIRADISKIKQLGWEPKISLDEGLKRTLFGIKHAGNYF